MGHEAKVTVTAATVDAIDSLLANAVLDAVEVELQANMSGDEVDRINEMRQSVSEQADAFRVASPDHVDIALAQDDWAFLLEYTRIEITGMLEVDELEAAAGCAAVLADLGKQLNL